MGQCSGGVGLLTSGPALSHMGATSCRWLLCARHVTCANGDVL